MCLTLHTYLTIINIKESTQYFILKITGQFTGISPVLFNDICLKRIKIKKYMTVNFYFKNITIDCTNQ